MELAWTNAYVFAGAQRPTIEYIDDILFDKAGGYWFRSLLQLSNRLYF